MKATYIDTSILVGILFGESAAKDWQRFLNTQDEIVSSFLIEAELLAAAMREKASLAQTEILLDCVSMIQPDRSLRKEYHRIFSLGFSKGADAFHLACALYLDPEGKELLFFTADQQQKQLAKKLGFRLPEIE